MYKISIIMPTFNVEKYIERSLKSIVNQTMNLDDIEVIMVDDCSTDSTKSIVKKYEKKYPNFKAIYLEKNSGNPSKPRNMGIEAASGKYLMFIDPDDEYLPNMCETLYSKIIENDMELVKCNHELILDGVSRKFYDLPKDIQEVELDCKKDDCPSSGAVWNAIHSKRFVIENNIAFPDLNVGEDVIFCILEFLNADKMLFLNNFHGYKYYANEDTSHSRKPTSKNLEDTLSSYFASKGIIEKYGKTERLKVLFSRHCSRFFIMLLDFEGDDKKYLKEFYEFESDLDFELDSEYLWLRVIHKLLIKKHFTLCVIYLKILRGIRSSPLLKIYRKFL